jgi:hypothetical protein
MKTQIRKPARERARYTEQHKQEALELWRGSGRSAAQVAAELGIVHRCSIAGRAWHLFSVCCFLPSSEGRASACPTLDRSERRIADVSACLQCTGALRDCASKTKWDAEARPSEHGRPKIPLKRFGGFKPPFAKTPPASPRLFTNAESKQVQALRLQQLLAPREPVAYNGAPAVASATRSMPQWAALQP